MSPLDGTPECAIVLSAGLGTRMRPLTDHRPKPLIEVAGRALIDRALDRCREAGVRHAVVNLHYLGDMIRAHLAGVTDPEIRFSDESACLLDTGGGIAKALPMLGPAPVFALNSDAVWTGPAPLPRLASVWRDARGEADSLLLLVPVERAHGYTRAGDFFLDGAVPRRRGAAERAPFVYTGAQIIAPAAFADVPAEPFSLNLVWDRLIAAGRLHAILHEGGWIDVGTPAGIGAAEAALSAGPAP